MSDIPAGGTRGILHARTGLEHFQVNRVAPPPELAASVLYFWLLRWDLRGRPPHRQKVLTRPSVHMTFTSNFTTGMARPQVVGVVRDEFVEEISGEGRVVGVAFRPGGFRPFLDGPVARLTGRFLDVAEVFGEAGRALGEKVFATPDIEDARRVLEEFLRGLRADPGPQGERAARIVERIAAAPGLVRVDDLAAELGMSARSMQRLFHEQVGIGPKWVIRRFRMQEAAERAAAGTDVDWAGLAAELGYADQAHFTRDFSASVGTSPARYARAAAGAPRPPGPDGA